MSGTIPKQTELLDLATCLLKEAPRQSKALLEAPLDTPGEAKIALQLVRGHNACIKGRVVSARVGELRGAVAEAFFAAEPTRLDRVAGLPPSARVRARANKRIRPFLLSYGSCLVDADPTTSVSLLRTPVASDAERAAFLAYGDNLKQCMALDAEYHVDIADVRNQIAALAYLRTAGAGTVG